MYYLCKVDIDNDIERCTEHVIPKSGNTYAIAESISISDYVFTKRNVHTYCFQTNRTVEFQFIIPSLSHSYIEEAEQKNFRIQR